MADGTYTGLGNRDIDVTKDITIKSENGPQTTVIDVQGGPGTPPHWGFHFAHGEGGVLEGFTIRNAFAVYGGAVACQMNTVVRGNVFEDNYVTGGGGAISGNEGALIANNIFRRNRASRGGAIIFSDCSGPVRGRNLLRKPCRTLWRGDRC